MDANGIKTQILYEIIMITYIEIYRNCRILYFHLQPLFLFFSHGDFFLRNFSLRPMLASSGEDLKIRLWGQESNKAAITSDELCEKLVLRCLFFRG